MHKKILYKFILAYIFIALAVFILISTLGAHLVEQALIEKKSRNLYQAASALSEEVSLKAVQEGTDSTLYRSLSLLASCEDAEIDLVNSGGKIYLNTSLPASEEPEEVLRNFNPASLNTSYYSTGTFFGHFSSPHLSVVVPITNSLQLQGYVTIHVPLSSLSALRESILAAIHLIFWIVFALFLFVFLLLAVNVLRPLKMIMHGTNEFASGNLKYNIPIHSHDEMGELASSLNYMSDELNKSGEYQREFIANVSHDFRSPLTSIKGYVEAMLDGTIPPELQGKYLHIVLSETERLTKLTSGILTLNTMDRKGSHLHCRDFDINAVIRDTAAAFEGICTNRQISINLTLTGETLSVYADLGKIQQVLYNLLDNAIKFSANNTTVEIETTLRHDKIFVTVKDHGCGIPSSSLKKIWDRFYKTDTSRGRERKGNGLGLAIVKQIMNEHKENITVISTEQVGTEFVFSLPKGKDS